MARTMARLTRRQTDHTPWYAQDHRCGVAEHRSADITADGIGGRAWLTRVRAGDVAYIGGACPDSVAQQREHGPRPACDRVQPHA